MDPQQKPPVTPTEKPGYNPRNMWLYIGIGVVGLFLFLLPFYYFLHANKPKVDINQFAEPTATFNQEDIQKIAAKPTTTQSGKITVTLQTYSTADYAFEYPDAWDLKVLTEEPTQHSVAVGPNLTNGTGKPAITVDDRVTTLAAMNSAEQVLVGTYGFSKTVKTINQKTFTAISGVMQSSVVNNKLVNVSHLEEVYDIYEKGIWYRLMFSYADSRKDPQLEAIFNHTLESFTITQQQ